MAADIDEKSDDSKELAESYVDLLPPKRSKLFAKLLTHRDKLRLVHYFEVLPVCWEPIIVNWWILIARCRTVSLSLYISVCLSVCLSLYICLSVEPQSGFNIAFNMFDTDGDQRVDKKEFLVVSTPTTLLIDFDDVRFYRRQYCFSLCDWRFFQAKNRRVLCSLMLVKLVG